MKFLVTGAPGWLGTRFVKAISGEVKELVEFIDPKEVEEVRCLVLPNLNHDSLTNISQKVRICHGNLTQPNTIKNFFEGSKGAILFHIAGLVHPKLFVKDFYKVNVGGTKNIIDEATRAGVKRIVIVSSNSPLGNNPTRDHLFTEESPYNPYMNYGKSKVKMESLVNDTFKRGYVETVIIRPCWFYGPDQPPRQTLFFSMIKNGKVPILGDGESRRSMSYIDNVCQGLLLARNCEKANGKTYWIADKKPYPMNEIINTVERLLENEFGFKVAHKRFKLPYVTGEVATLVDLILQGVGIYHQKIHVLSEMNKTIACSIDKAEKELNYKPKIQLEEGMRRSIKWCVESGIKI